MADLNNNGFDHLLKAQLQEGAVLNADDFDSEDAGDRQVLQSLNTSIDWLFEAVIKLQETMEKQSSSINKSTPTFTPSSEQSFVNGAAQTHDVESYLSQTIPGYLTPAQRESFRENLRQTEEDIKNHVTRINQDQQNGIHVSHEEQQQVHEEQQHVNEEKQRLADQERREEELANTFINQLEKFFGNSINVGGHAINAGATNINNAFSNISSQYTGKATQALSSELGGGEAAGFVAQLLPKFLTMGNSLGELAARTFGLSTAIGALIPTVLGAVTALGAFNAVNFLNERNSYNKNVLQNSPGNYASLTNGSGLSQHEFLEVAKHHLLTSRSDKDVESLLNSVISSRPSKGTTQQQAQNSAFILGYLQDMGLSPQKSSSSLNTMTQSLNMSTDSAVGQLVNIANTAKVHSLDLNTYVEKITQVTMGLRGLGSTVESVNNTFEGYSQRILSNGSHVNMDEALRATQMEGSFGKNASLSESIFAAQTTGSNIKIGSSLGLEGTGNQTLGELAGQGGFGAALAGMYLKAAKPELSFAAIGQRELLNVQQMMPQLNGNEDAQKLMLASNMKSKGLISGDISDPAVAAVLDKIIKHQNESPEKLAKSLGDEVKKLIPQPLDKVMEELGHVFGTEFSKSHDELLKEYNKMLGWEELWEDINNMLGATFLPIVLRMTAELGAIGEAIHTYASTGDLGKAGSAWETSRGYWQKQINKIANEDGVKEYLEKSPISDLMLSFTSIGENQQKANSDFGKAIGNAAAVGLNGLTNPLNENSALSLSGLHGHSDGMSSSGKLYDRSMMKFSNIGFHTNDKMTLGQAGFLATLNSSTGGAGFKPQIFALQTNHGHSDHKGGEHKKGNAIDISISELSKAQKIKLGQILSSNPYVKDIGVTTGGGREGGISFDKIRNLAGHTDHFHVRLRDDASDTVSNQISQELESVKAMANLDKSLKKTSRAGSAYIPSGAGDSTIYNHVDIDLDTKHISNKKTERKLPKATLARGSKS